MRHGHCKHLLCNSSATHGRASFSRSIHGKSVPKHCRSESQSWAYQKHRNKFNLKTKACVVDDCPGQGTFAECFAPAEKIDWYTLLDRPRFPFLACFDYSEQEQLIWDRDSACAKGQCAPDSEKKCPTLWEEGQARATRAARTYAVNLPLTKRTEGVTVPLATSMDRAPAILTLPPPVHPATPFAEPPPGAGGPPAPEEHDCVKAVATLVCKEMQKQVGTTKVAAGSTEYDSVVDYFLRTVMVPDAAIVELRRIQNLPVYTRYRPRGSETVMFHGCRSQANEDNIIRDGFQVSCCRSGGEGFGTWLAYSAAYSNGGYAFQDSDGVRHILVCMVSYNHTVMDNHTMRVVGQECAYPVWLLKYKTPCNIAVPRAVVVARIRPDIFYVVRDGKWVPEVARKMRRK